jgi:HK97 family phage major capsid protein
MSSDTIKIPSTLFRAFEIKKGTVDKEKRSVPMSFSSELPVRRTTDDGDVYNEILDHNPDSVMMDRLASGSAPLLMHHDPKDQVGVVKMAKLDGKRGMADVQFSKSKRGQEIMDDVDDGIRGSTSVGYQVHSMDQDEDCPEDEDGVPNYRCRWEPLEISLESIPADHTVGAGRNNPTVEKISVPIKRKTPKTMITRTRQLAAEATAGGGTVTITEDDVQKRSSDAVKVEKLRVADINGYARQLARKENPGEFFEDAQRMIAENKSASDMLELIAFKRTNVKPLPAAQVTDTTIGMSDKETQQYSIVRAIRMKADAGGGYKLEGLEKECHEAALKKSGRNLNDPKAFMIPEDVIRAKFRGEGFTPGRMNKRDMQAGVFAQGGAFVETEVLGSALIELLRNKMQVVNAGARTMAGLKNNCAIPRQTGASTAYWLGEIAAVTESDQILNQLLLTPHRLAANTAYSNLLLAQATLDAEAFVRMDLMKQLAIAKDLAALSGTGGAQPIGIINTTGVGTQTVTPGAPTWAQIVGCESTVAAANADFGALAYLVSAQGRGVLKQTPKIGTTFPIFMWENPVDASKAAEGEGTVNGYRALATNQLNTATNGDKVIYGNWEDVIIADWEGWEVLVDPYTLSKNGEVQVTIFNFTDIGIRHPGSFCYSPQSLI